MTTRHSRRPAPRLATGLLTAAAVATVATVVVLAGCERSNKDKIEDGVKDIGSGVSGAAKDAADKVAEGLEKADDKVGELVDD